MTTETTALTIIQRAAVALGSSKAETELTALALQSKSITAVTSADGRTECHAAAMTAKAARVNVEKAGKAARDDATQFSKAVISEEKRLISLIEPEETRLIELRDEWDSAIAREKAAKAEAERLALVQIMTRIAQIKNWPLLTTNATSAAVLDDIKRLEALEIDDSFKTYFGEAAEAKAVSLEKLREIHAAKVRAEAEAIRVKQEQDEQFARMKAEREELAKQRAEQDAKDAAERAERDAELKRIQAIRDEITATQMLLAAEKAATEKREADRIAKEQVLTQQPLTASPAVPVLSDKAVADTSAREFVDSISPTQPAVLDLSEEIDAALAVMTDSERVMVLHYCNRLIMQRQSAA